MRKNKDEYYLDIAKAVSERGTCLRRNYGAIIVNNDEIISAGYTGSPRGEDNCNEVGKCERVRLKIPSGEQYEKCCSVHAEMNAIISASRKDMIGSTLYLYGFEVSTHDLLPESNPCSICSRLIKNAGIAKVISYSYNTNKEDKIIKMYNVGRK